MKAMNWKVKRCRTSRKVFAQSCVADDRLSSLPDELMTRILSTLPTKDVLALQVLSKTINTKVFSWITSVDLDDSPINYNHYCPRLLRRFPHFVLFVDNALHKLSLFGQPISRFRLHVGAGVDNTHTRQRNPYERYHSFPHLDPSRLNTWISYPLALLNLRELDLCFIVYNPSTHQLPPALFVCASLQTLKLNSNLKLDGAQIPLVSLPNLKLLHLYSLFIPEDTFITRLVSSCPSLEDLDLTSCWWGQSDCLSISSLSLQTLKLYISKCDKMKCSDLVHIHTPNLKSFSYTDNLAHRYCVTTMDALVQAEFVPGWPTNNHVRAQLSLLPMLSNAKHLSLRGHFLKYMNDVDKFKGRLPVFHNLTTLELGNNHDSFERWGGFVSEILLCSPNLESLSFPYGLLGSIDRNDTECVDLFTEPPPRCFVSTLKRIVIMDYRGTQQELTIITILLKKVSNLQEMVLFLSKVGSDIPLRDRKLSLERTLKNLPMASTNCSILFPARKKNKKIKCLCMS